MKLDGKSMNIIEQNIEKLKEIFPEVFSEGKIDFSKLEEELGSFKENENERYNFTWNGKSEAKKIALTPSTGTLRPCKTESKNWDKTQNLYIEGDNLEVLKLLQKSYHKKVKMIYIDPPYNTGKDFVYKDNFRDNIKNYLEITGQVDSDGNKLSTNSETSGRYHSDWLNMMYPRLKLARNLLKDDGVIFISIDDNEVANLRKLCDEIFGEDNFLGEVIWETATDNNASQISIEHEYILCFCRNKDYQDKWQIESEKGKIIQEKFLELKKRFNSSEEIQIELRKWINSLKKSNDIDLSGVSHYSYVDDKGVYYPGNSNNTKKGDYNYDIKHPITSIACKKPSNGWRWPETTFWNADKIGDVEWGKDETTIPKIKKRLETATELLKSYYYEDNRKTTSDLNTLLDGKLFENPKSIRLLNKLIKFSTKDNEIILDFFSGSATTAHAVMKLNSEDDGNRKFICVQLPESTDEKSEAYKAGYKNICEIGKERIRRAGEKVKNESGKSGLDIGFKVLKLDSSNIKSWDSDFENLETNLLDAVENIKSDRNEEDLLYEILLKYGLDLTLPIEEKEVNGKKLYNIGFGALIICLDSNISIDITDEIIAIKKEHDSEITRVVFKDSGFKNATEKTNIIKTLNQNGIDEVVSV
ncbi:site-specific DNA-methyltransferase [Aliarcobacter butzleri]|uniref:site-specific DNA-methyltransferase n=1 Tax=Aliarcobacter butzleri TaxID=28197 RepID=UPI0024DE00B7|nr:site-specific DNA-methyltransferase [Aliarcobacter butzleri]MDK2080407.1 site-specific DNA-methyltransferase [Aliarcobacter butzleri]